jgi:type II secretory pathway pseudopilin PulG
MRCGFTLIESLVSITLTVVAGCALLYGVYDSMGNTKRAVEQTISAGLAQQMMDEIAGMKYCDDYSQPYQWPLTANASELAGPGRSLFNDIDDYVGLRYQPPADRWNIPLGDGNGSGGTRYQNFRISSYLANWRVEIDVYYVSNTDLTTALASGQTSNYRAVEVRVYINDSNGARRLLTTLRRVFAYVPSS